MIMAQGLWFITKLSATSLPPFAGMGVKLFDILGKLLDEYLIILSITFFRTHHFLVGLKFMWSGNNYKNNKF
jgi:hypothetical protein